MSFTARLLLTGSTLVTLTAASSFATSTILPASGTEIPCQGTAPAQTNITGVTSAYVSVPGLPFGVIYAPDGNRAFTTFNTTLGILDTSSFEPRLLQEVSLANTTGGEEGALGLALTRSGHHLLVAQGQGVVVLDVLKLSGSAQGAIVGSLIGPGGTAAIEVTVSADDRYAFVSQEYGPVETVYNGGIQVFDLQRAIESGFTTSAYIGYLSLGQAVVGSALSRDGSTIYVTSEIIEEGDNSTLQQGGLSIIDVQTLVTEPAKALLGTVYTGCQPVRIAISDDGETIWITARSSNRVLAYNGAKLLSDPTTSLLASVQVGTSPVGVVLVDGGRRILTADSDRFNISSASSGLTVIDTQAALNGLQEGLGRISTGLFPREFAVSPDGSTLLVTDYQSLQLQAIDIRTLP